MELRLRHGMGNRRMLDNLFISKELSFFSFLKALHDQGAWWYAMGGLCAHAWHICIRRVYIDLGI
jgi:hypothetical protein